MNALNSPRRLGAGFAWNTNEPHRKRASTRGLNVKVGTYAIKLAPKMSRSTSQSSHNGPLSSRACDFCEVQPCRRSTRRFGRHPPPVLGALKPCTRTLWRVSQSVESLLTSLLVCLFVLCLSFVGALRCGAVRVCRLKTLLRTTRCCRVSGYDRCVHRNHGIHSIPNDGGGRLRTVEPLNWSFLSCFFFFFLFVPSSSSCSSEVVVFGVRCSSWSKT